MKAKDFEKKFDEDIDITQSLDLSKAKRVLQVGISPHRDQLFRCIVTDDYAPL